MSVHKDVEIKMFAQAWIKVINEKNIPIVLEHVEFGYYIKEDYKQLYEKPFKILSCPDKCVCEVRFYSHTSTKIICCNSLNAETDMRF